LFQDLTINALDMAELVFLIMEPRIGHLVNVRKCLDVMKNLKYPEDKIKLLVNRIGHHNGIPVEEVQKNVPVKVSFTVADDYPGVIQLVDNSKVIFDANPESPYARDLKRIVSALIGKPIDAVEGSGLLGRIKGWFSQ